MKVEDIMEVMGVISKLNQTIDGQQEVINEYQKKYGPLNLSEAKSDDRKEAAQS